LILETLRRLKPEALALLRAVPGFSNDAYKIALDIPIEAQFRKLVMRYPMIGAEIEHLAFDRPKD
jgi:hypothetical protein